MAIVKATYTKKIGAAKASVRYIEHRPGQDGARIIRTLFGKEGTVERKHAYQKIDEATRVKRCTFYRFVISPDAKIEDTGRDLHLQEVTRQTMQTLEELVKTPLYWVAAEHADHTAYRHVHVMAVIQRVLTSLELEMLRKSATEACLQQRKERDLLREQGQAQEGGLTLGWER